MSSNMLKAPGSGYATAAAQKAQAEAEQAKTTAQGAEAQRKGLWEPQFLQFSQQLAPLYGSMFAGAQGGGMGYSPNIDVTGTGQDVYEANVASSTQSLADQYNTLMQQAQRANLQRGLGQTSFGRGSMSDLAIQRSQDEARNMAGALTQKLGVEQSLRGEERQAYLDKLADYWARMQALSGREATLAGYADPAQALAMQQAIAAMFGDVGQTYTNVAQANAAYSPLSLLGTAGGVYAGKKWG